MQVDRHHRPRPIYTKPVTFREGLTIAEMADVYAARGLGAREALVTAAADASLVRDLDPLATDLEGYLFPDTYLVPRHTPAAGAGGADGARIPRRLHAGARAAVLPRRDCPSARW